MEQMRERVARVACKNCRGTGIDDPCGFALSCERCDGAGVEPVSNLYRFNEQIKAIMSIGPIGCCNITEKDASDILTAMQPEIARRVAEEKADLESKFRCVVSHATGGNFQDIDASLNEISVRISQFRTQLWEQAKQIGAKEERAKMLERFDEDGLEQIISDSLDMDWRPRDAARAIRQAMLAQFEKESPDEQG